MTTPQGPGAQPPTSSPMKKYGPLIGIVVVIAIVLVVVTVVGKKDSSSNNAANTTGTNAPAGNPNDAPMTYQQAKAQGKEGSVTWNDNCDPATGRIKMPSVFAPPCLPKFTGDNGGATGQGVTADKVTVVNYVPPTNNDLLSMFTSQLDPPEKVIETSKKYQEMFQSLFQTYGRQVEVIDYNATGQPQDAIAAQADAQTVLEKYHPFASLGGPILTSAYAEELARNQVLCIGCGQALPDQFYQDHAPYIWGAQPSPEELLQNLTPYVADRLLNKPAKFAGDDNLKNKTRSFGVVHFEQDPPVFSSIADQVQKCGAAQGWQAADIETYTFDIGKMPERATTIVAKLKEQGVTTVIFLGDPIMPIYLTKAATAQDYHPEWIVTGTVLTDTTVLGRFYDPEQWKHAFGISNLAARTPQAEGEPWRLHQWYFGTDPAATGTNALIYVALQQVYLGIHMAGPHLNAQTFKQGMFNYPESGGGPTNPHVSFGDHGYFKQIDPGTCNPNTVRPDYLGSDDVAEIWWDATATGPDEQNKSDKPGMWRYSDMGKRYLPGQMPKDDVHAFRMENTVTIYDKPPKEDAAPTYPPPPNAPAASGTKQ